MRRNVTTAQLRALQTIAANSEGRGYPGSAAFTISTARALARKGLIEVVTPPRHVGSEVVSNAFGRGWHTRPVFHGPVVKLTEDGKRAAEETQ